MAWDLLLSTDIGWLSLFTIGFILAMAIWILLYVRKHIREDEQKQLH